MGDVRVALRCVERAVAPACQHTGGAAAVVGDYQVGPAVNSHVSHGHRNGVAASCVIDRRPESAVTVVQEYADVAAAVVSHRQVLRAVVVEVGDLDGIGVSAGWVADTRL